MTRSLLSFLIFIVALGWITSTETFAQDAPDTVSLDTGNLVHDSLPQPIDEASHDRQRISEELDFVKHLVSAELYSEALVALATLMRDSTASNVQHDSIRFYRGWILYFNQRFNEAIKDFEQVDTASPSYHASAFHHAICYMYLDSNDRARDILEQTHAKGDSKIEALKRFELAGIALMQRDYHRFDSLARSFEHMSYQFAKEEDALMLYADTMRSFKRKSPALAGLLSALVPGLGKFYVGYRGTPFGAFTLTAPFAAIAIETFIIGGVTSIPFLIAAPVFAVFYIGNIWGSVLSAYAFEKEFYGEMDHNILYDLHIPMRRIFLQ